MQILFLFSRAPIFIVCFISFCSSLSSTLSCFALNRLLKTHTLSLRLINAVHCEVMVLCSSSACPLSWNLVYWYILYPLDFFFAHFHAVKGRDSVSLFANPTGRRWSLSRRHIRDPMCAHCLLYFFLPSLANSKLPLDDSSLSPVIIIHAQLTANHYFKIEVYPAYEPIIVRMICIVISDNGCQLPIISPVRSHFLTWFFSLFRRVDPIQLLAITTGRRPSKLAQYSSSRRRRVLRALIREAKSVNHTLLRLNNEMQGEWNELNDQRVNLSAQLRHLGLHPPSWPNVTFLCLTQSLS